MIAAECGGLAVTDALFDEAQFAFVGRVAATADLIHPWTTDPENPDRADVGTPTPWVTFDVEHWYLNDWGTTFSVWMPDGEVTVGQRLAVGGNAYHTEVGDFSGQSGEVEFCTPVADHELTPAEWDTRLGEPFRPSPAAPAPTTSAAAPATKVFGDHTSPCEPTVLRNGVDDPRILESGAACLLAEFEASRPVVWDVLLPTVEGDPILTRYEFDGATVTITTDHSFDTYGSGGVTEQRCTGIRPSGWLPEGVDCTTSSGEGFQPDSVRIAQSRRTGSPQNYGDVDALIAVAEFDGERAEAPAPYFGSQNGGGGPAKPLDGFVPAAEDQVFCWAVKVINSRPQPRNEFQEVVMADHYFAAIQPFAVAAVAAELDALVDFTHSVVARGSFTEEDEVEPGAPVADAYQTVNTFVDQHCLGLA